MAAGRNPVHDQAMGGPNPWPPRAAARIAARPRRRSPAAKRPAAPWLPDPLALARSGFGQGLLAVAGATAAALVLGLGAEPGVFAPFLVAVAAIAIAYGLGPALATIAGSLVAAYLWLLAPLADLAFDPHGLRRLAVFRLAVFAAAGLAIALLAEAQRRRHADLERSRRQLRAFIANPDVGMQVIDHDGRVIWADDTMHRLLGYADGEYVGTTFASAYADAALAADVTRRLAAGGVVENVRAVLQRKDGGVTEVLLNANTLLGDAGTAGSGVLVAALPVAAAAATEGGKLAVASLVERRRRAAAELRDAAGSLATPGSR
jgi:PAS domain S-box-containing protein